MADIEMKHFPEEVDRINTLQDIKDGYPLGAHGSPKSMGGFYATDAPSERDLVERPKQIKDVCEVVKEC